MPILGKREVAIQQEWQEGKRDKKWECLCVLQSINQTKRYRGFHNGVCLLSLDHQLSAYPRGMRLQDVYTYMHYSFDSRMGQPVHLIYECMSERPVGVWHG